MNRAAIIALCCALALALAWSVAHADAPLTITLTAPPTCEADFDGRAVTPSLDLQWQATGGDAPYNILVNGERYEGAAGVANLICGVWADEQSEDEGVDSGLMTILAHATDAAGEAASAVQYVYAVRVVRQDADEIRLAPGHTYRVHGLLLTMPDEFGASVSDYISDDCTTDTAECGDYFILSGCACDDLTTVLYSMALSRWNGNERARRVWLESGDQALAEDRIAAANAALDRLVASIGRPRPTSLIPQGASTSTAGDLSITLFAPAICETHLGPYRSDRQSIEVQWEISGGAAPYRILFAQQTLDGARGVITLPCGQERADQTGVDSQLMATQALATDATGAAASAVVNTYAIAAGRFGGDLLRGGWTHRMEGLLMTIPQGLDFDVRVLGGEEVSCSEGTCTHAGCLDSGMPICQSSWSMWTLDGAVSVAFGYVTRSMIRRNVNAARIADDPGVNVDTPAQVERLLDQLAASIGKPPQLPADGVFNPAPLRITAWADPVTCTGRIQPGEWRYARVQRRVSGGYWWPLGVGNEAWDAQKHNTTSARCPTTWGSHAQVLEVHEHGPSPASAETTVRHLTPPELGDGVLVVAYGSWSSTTFYCKPGGSRHIRWQVSNGTGPYRATLNGIDVEFDYWHNPDVGNGNATVACADTVGLQAVTLEVWDSSQPAHHTIHPIILSIVEQHPSGQPWSDFD